MSASIPVTYNKTLLHLSLRCVWILNSSSSKSCSQMWVVTVGPCLHVHGYFSFSTKIVLCVLALQTHMKSFIFWKTFSRVKIFQKSVFSSYIGMGTNQDFWNNDANTHVCFWLPLISLGIISGRRELRVCVMILCMMEWILHFLYLERQRQTLKTQWWKTETRATLAQWHSIIQEDSVSRSHISLPHHFCPVLSKM